MTKLAVLAIGGNSLIKDKQHETVEDQYDAVCETAKHIAGLIEQDYNVVVTHGNGPQVGNLLIQQSRAKTEVPAMPLDVCVAGTQGQIGYWIQRILVNELRRRGKEREVSAVLSMMLVDKGDPAFNSPSKPIGPWFSREEMLQARKEEESWIEHAEKGWRKVVPSPRPVKMINARSIESLLKSGHVVIACGGGGIPVIENGSGNLVGIEAVIDKDLASERLAADIHAYVLMILSDVPAVFLDYGMPEEKPIYGIDVKQMRQLFEKGIFAEGTIGPKVEAAMRFVENGGERAIIASLEDAENALKGKAGTFIVRG